MYSKFREVWNAIFGMCERTDRHRDTLISILHFTACAKEKEVKVAIHILLNMLWQVQMTSQKLKIFTRRRSWSFVEYCKHFVAHLKDVHAFGYNAAGSERIWMKFGELRVYCLELSLTNFGCDPRRSGSGSASRNFVFFCPLNNARFHRLPESISPKWLQILESHDRLDRLWNVDFPLTPLKWTQNNSHGL